MELTGDMVELMNAAKQFQFKSPRPCCLRRIDTAQTWGNEPWSIPSVYHNINGQGFRGHHNEGALHKGMMAIFFWFVFYHCDHFRWGLTPDLLRKIFLIGPPTHGKLVGIHRFTVIGSWSTELGFYSRPECHKIFIGTTIIIFRYEYKQLISINVFNPVDPKIFYFI